MYKVIITFKKSQIKHFIISMINTIHRFSMRDYKFINVIYSISITIKFYLHFFRRGNGKNRLSELKFYILRSYDTSISPLKRI